MEVAGRISAAQPASFAPHCRARSPAVSTNTSSRIEASLPLGRTVTSLTCGQRLATVAANASAASRRSEEHTSELQALMRISYAVFCLKKKTHINKYEHKINQKIAQNDIEMKTK